MPSHPAIRALLAAFMLVTTVPVGLVAGGQPQLLAVNSAFDPQGLTVAFRFDHDISSFGKCFVSYREIKGQFTSPAKTGSFSNRITNDYAELIATLSTDQFEDADQIEMKVNVEDAKGQTVYSSPSYIVDLKEGKYLATTSNEIARLKDAVGQFQSDIRKKDEAIAALTSKTQISSINFEAIQLRADTKIVFSLVTNVAGKVQATIRGDNGIMKTAPPSAISTRHVIVFDQLVSSSSYDISAVALNIADGTPLPKTEINPQREPRLHVTTLQPLPTLGLTVVATPTDSAIKVLVKADSPGVAEVECDEITNPSIGQIGRSYKYGVVGTDENGKPTGATVMMGDNTFTCEGLSPDTQHEVKVTAVDLYGRPAKKPFQTPIRTLTRPVPLDFAQDLSVELSPLTGIKMTWSATTPPKEAFFDVVFDEKTVVTKKATVKENQLTAEMDVDKLGEILNTAKDKKTPPELRVRMNDGQHEVTRLLKVSYVIPSKQAVSSSPLSSDSKKQLTNVVDSIEKNKKVDWKVLLSTGLGLLVKFL